MALNLDHYAGSNAFPAEDDCKQGGQEADDSDSIDSKIIALLRGESNKIGDQIMNSSPGALWSIGNNAYGQHGNGTQDVVEQLAIHQWAENIDFVKVVTNGTIYFA